MIDLRPKLARTFAEAILWDVSDGNPFDPDRLRGVLNQRCENALIRVDANQPVVCLDDNFQELDDLCDIGAAVRIQPDDWPPFADQAWTDVSRASAIFRLRAATMESDRERLDGRGNDA